MNTTDKHVIEGYEELYSIQLAGRQLILAESKMGGEAQPYMVCECRWDNPLNVNEYYNAEITGDYLEAMNEFSRRLTDMARFLEAERDSRGLSAQALTADDCVPGGMDEDMTGKYVVVRPEVLSPEYRTSDHQIGLCRGGNGARPQARGSAVFLKNLYSGKESRYERRDIAGVIDPEKTPAWAREKLATNAQEKDAPGIEPDGTFEYGGCHFTPCRNFQKGEIDRKAPNDSRPWKGDMQYAMRNMSTDMELGISKYPWQKADYSYEAFYAASGGSAADIFRCVENGSLYVPGANELFRYEEPRTRAKSAHKNSVLSALDDAKKQAAGQTSNTARKKNEPAR